MSTVFLVEDEELVALQLEAGLQDLGYTVLGHALSGYQAIREIPRLNPDVVIMDVNLGTGPSGIDVAKRVMPSFDGSIVFLSGYSDSGLSDNIADTDSFAFVTKPFSLDVLKTNIEMALRHRSLEKRLEKANRLLESATEELRASEAFAQTVINSLTSLLAVLDNQGIVVSVNETWKQSARDRKVASEMIQPIGVNYLTVFQQVFGRCDGAAASSVVNGIRDVWEGSSTLFEQEFASGDWWFWITAQPMAGPYAGVVVAHEDITERKRAEELARRLQERFESVFDFSPDALLMVNQQGTIVLANRQAEELFGYSKVEFLSLTVEQLIPEQFRETHIGSRNRFQPGERPRPMGVRSEGFQVLCRDGSIIPVEIGLGFVGTEQGTGILAAIRDISERVAAQEARQELEAQLRQSQKIEAIGTLAGGVAHDFNNLLTGILGFSTLALLQLDENHPAHAAVGEIQTAGERAAALTAQLLAFSRKQILTPEEIDLNQLVGGITAMLHRLIDANIKLTTHLSANPALVKADRSQMEQVLVNLVVNARDAMPKGGRLSIDTAEEDLLSSPILGDRDFRPGCYIRLTVADTGVGMPPRVQDRIFEPFFTTKEQGKGTGLGLSTVFGIVKQSNGFLTVESIVGEGSRFSVFLPATGPEKTTQPNAASPVPNAMHGPKTLVLVEDEPQVRRLAKSALELAGFEVLEFTDGEEALQMITGRKEPVDLLITDIIMPGMSGPQLVDHLRLNRPRLSVLYISGYPDETIRNHGVLKPGIDLLLKPFLPEELVRRVRAALDR